MRRLSRIRRKLFFCLSSVNRENATEKLIKITSLSLSKNVLSLEAVCEGVVLLSCTLLSLSLTYFISLSLAPSTALFYLVLFYFYNVCVSFRVILALGISMTFINIPVEWFSIGFNWTWMLLFGDIRQGIFYSMLLSFWIIFCGEHLMVQAFTLFIAGLLRFLEWQWSTE